MYKVPLSPPQDQTSTNTIPSPLPNVSGMPAAGAIAVGIDGVPMYPNYNNRGLAAATSCEIDRCNAHSGKGDDYHYHGDPYGEKCLYSESDYTTTHPPIIGFSLDGYLIYGRHITAGIEGESVSLDACGGHSHASYGYHYHSTVSVGLSTNSLDGVGGSGPFSYNTYDVAPTTCWKGDVSQIANFWSGSQVAYDRSKTMDPSSWVDVENVKPCCSSTKFLTAHGVTLNGAGTCEDSQTCTFGTGEGAATDYTECNSSTSTCCYTGTTTQTKNTASYTCSAKNIEIANSYEISSSSLTNNFSCSQTSISSATPSSTVTVDCTGIGSGEIHCLTIASLGKVAGSCGSCETSLADESCYAYLPETVGESCIGKTSCEISLSFSGATTSSVSSTIPFVTDTNSSPASTTYTQTTCGSGASNYKMLAYCGPGTSSSSGGNGSGSTPPPPPPGSSTVTQCAR